MVFVDKKTHCVPNPHWKWDMVCHMFCDGDIEELHLMAEAIGLKRGWFQKGNGVTPTQRAHYDLTPRRRKAALRAGAREATRNDICKWLGREDLMR